MTERLTRETLHGPVYEHMRTDFVQLHPDLTVARALELILEKQPAGRIVYFYVADSDGRLLGVVPTRRLLLSPRDRRLSQIMIEPVITRACYALENPSRASRRVRKASQCQPASVSARRS